MQAKTILVTGGAGFIGGHLARHLLAQTDWQIVNVDLLTYAADPATLQEFEGNPRHKFFQADIADKDSLHKIFAEFRPTLVAHLAAETHVDNSIRDASPFMRTNVVGTHTLLELAREFPVEKFLYVSTDEVYGDLPVQSAEKFTEQSPLRPSSPYSASKASGDLLVQAYHRTYGLPTVISRCSNNYGTHQFPEKLIPFFVQKLLRGERLPVYGTGENVREWLAVEDHAAALHFLLEKAPVGEVFNIGSNTEKSNLEIAHTLCEIFGKNPSETVEFVADRPGHDRRYALDSSRLRALGWAPQQNFSVHFSEVVAWYRAKFSV